MNVVSHFDDSRFWLRLDQLSRTRKHADERQRIDHLKSSVRKVADQAKWISSQVCRYMPQYTLHEERHFLNVLGIMDALTPGHVMEHLTPLECAIPILAAYTRWLEAIKHETGDMSLFKYGVNGKDFQRELRLLGIRHGRGAPWLRRHAANDDRRLSNRSWRRSPFGLHDRSGACSCRAICHARAFRTIDRCSRSDHRGNCQTPRLLRADDQLSGVCASS